MPIISLEDLLACLRVEEHAPDRYTAPNIAMPYRRIFGGQLLAQAMVIAGRTAEGKCVKSLRATFPREGDLAEPVEWRVERFQDGRSFAGRWLLATQGERIIAAISVSLHAPESGLEHQLDAPEVGPPEAATPVDLGMVPWETRAVGGVDLASRETGPARYELWMRAPQLPDDGAIHAALLAHASDLTLIGTTLRPHAGLSEADSPERIATAVTTHDLWLHREVRLSDWLLLAQESPVAAGARGFGWGHAFARDGALVASYAQESLIRSI